MALYIDDPPDTDINRIVSNEENNKKKLPIVSPMDQTLKLMTVAQTG